MKCLIGWLVTGWCMVSSMAGVAEVSVRAVPERPTAKTVLFNGRDFSGWTQVVTVDADCPSDDTWRVVDGTIHCAGKPFGYLATQRVYADYKLSVRYRWLVAKEPLNSGVFVHKTGPDVSFLPKAIETQLKAGHAGDFVLLSQASVNGITNHGVMVVSKQAASSEKPCGEWNQVEIEARGDRITVWINGVLQNRGERASASAGQICLQSEGGPIAFKDVFLEPLSAEK